MRILAALGPKTTEGHLTTLVGTNGLWAFGAQDIEFQPHPVPMNYFIPRAYAVSAYLLRQANQLSQGDTIAIGHETYKAEILKSGAFSPRSTARLSTVMER